MSELMVFPDEAQKKVGELLESQRRVGRWEAYVSCADQHLLVVPAKRGADEGFTIEVGGKEGTRAGWWATRAEAADVCRSLSNGFRLLAGCVQEGTA